MRGREGTLTLVALVLFVFFAITADNFFTLSNVYDMARTSTYLLIVGVALTFVFIAGEIDLSVGSLFGLCAVVMGLLIVKLGLDPWLAAFMTVGAGLLVGCINGGIVTNVGVPSFIVTLGMYSLLRGAALVITGGLPLVFGADALQSSFIDLASGRIGDFPVVILWGVAVVVLGGCVLKLTIFGSHVYATGGNAGSAKAAGISTNRVKFACFAITGAACGLVAALQTALLSEANPTTGSGFELQVIAAVIIGGVSLTGGGGSVYGTVVGAAIVGMLPNGLVLMGVEANWNQFFIGLIIVAVGTLEVALSRRRRSRRSERASGSATDPLRDRGADGDGGEHAAAGAAGAARGQ
ncbi:MAG TPA: ABC transporter permease [Conexibacter sp.]